MKIYELIEIIATDRKRIPKEIKIKNDAYIWNGQDYKMENWQDICLFEDVLCLPYCLWDEVEIIK